MIASAIAVELMAAILQHPLKYFEKMHYLNELFDLF